MSHVADVRARIERGERVTAQEVIEAEDADRRDQITAELESAHDANDAERRRLEAIEVELDAWSADIDAHTDAAIDAFRRARAAVAELHTAVTAMDRASSAHANALSRLGPSFPPVEVCSRTGGRVLYDRAQFAPWKIELPLGQQFVDWVEARRAERQEG